MAVADRRTEASCQHPEGVSSVRRPVVAGLVAPAAALLVPFLAIAFSALSPSAQGPAFNSQCGSIRARLRCRRRDCVRISMHGCRPVYSWNMLECETYQIPTLSRAIMRPEGVA